MDYDIKNVEKLEVVTSVAIGICKLCKLLNIPTETITNAILLAKKLDNKFNNLKG